MAQEAREMMSGLVSVTNGRPTEMQAKPLVERFKGMQPGDTVGWSEMVSLAGEECKSIRLRTVCNAARKTLHKETGVVLKAVNGVGLRMPSGDEQVRHGVDWVRSGVRKIKAGTSIVASITDERLTDKGRSERVQVTASLVALQRAADDEQKKLRATFKATQALPQAKE